MRNVIAAALALCAQPFAAAAAPEGMWPQEANGISLPPAEWVLVVPARREADGSVTLWDKEDAWTREWTVPRATPAGTRTVAIVGDSEDRRAIDGWRLDSMDLEVLGKLARKYRAPAVAIAVKDGEGEAAVAGWSEGNGASWRPAGPEGGRNGVLASIDEIFSGGDGQDNFDVAITGQRFDGRLIEYRIETGQPIIDEVLAGIPGLEVVGHEYDAESPSTIVRVVDGRDIEAVLRSAGIRVR